MIDRAAGRLLRPREFQRAQCLGARRRSSRIFTPLDRMCPVGTSRLSSLLDADAARAAISFASVRNADMGSSGSGFGDSVRLIAELRVVFERGLVSHPPHKPVLHNSQGVFWKHGA